jgi:hypothetical protein
LSGGFGVSAAVLRVEDGAQEEDDFQIVDSRVGRCFTAGFRYEVCRFHLVLLPASTQNDCSSAAKVSFGRRFFQVQSSRGVVGGRSFGGSLVISRYC